MLFSPNFCLVLLPSDNLDDLPNRFDLRTPARNSDLNRPRSQTLDAVNAVLELHETYVARLEDDAAGLGVRDQERPDGAHDVCRGDRAENGKGRLLLLLRCRFCGGGRDGGVGV